MPSATQPPADPPSAPVGRRERKKAETRGTIARAALELFLAEGFDRVSIRQIAERADVAVATVFAHFPGKEALVFDEEDAVLASLLDAVRRDTSGDPLHGLEEWFLRSRAAQDTTWTGSEYARFRGLVDRTPALLDHWRTTWRRQRQAVAAALTETTDLDPEKAELVAALVIEGYLLAADRDDTLRTLELLFATLRDGVDRAG